MKDIEQREKELVFRAEAKDAAAAVSAVCASGVMVFQMTREKRSLEQAFMEITAREGGVGI